MSSMLLSVSGHDRPGIVRDVAQALEHLNANIEDSSMTLLRGRFTMMLIVRLNEQTSLGQFRAALAELEQRTRLSVQSQPISDEEATADTPDPDHVVTLHGADRVGIVYAVTHALAELDISIIDLSTRAQSSEDGQIYMMVLEVSAGNRGSQMRQALAGVADEMGVDIDIHELNQAVL